MSQEASFKRSEALQALRTRHFDLVVIGGGITGAGAVSYTHLTLPTSDLV